MQSQKIKQTATEEDAGCGPLASAHTRVGACTSKRTHAQRKQHKNSQLDKNSEVCQEVQAVCDALGVPKSDTSDIPLLLSQVESKVKDILSKVQKKHV